MGIDIANISGTYSLRNKETRAIPTNRSNYRSVSSGAAEDAENVREAIALATALAERLARPQNLDAAEVDGVQKYNPDEPRDWHGRWTTDPGGSGGQSPRQPDQHARFDRPHRRRQSRRNQGTAQSNGNAGSATTRPASGSRSSAPGSSAAQMLSLTLAQRMWPAFEAEYDQLGPVAFSKRVTDFGEWLGSQRNLSISDKAAAYARYVFLEDRLNFWMSYPTKPARAQDNLLSASSILFQGAQNAQVVTDVEHLPLSYVRAGLVAMQYEGPRLHAGRRPGADAEEPIPTTISRRWPEELILGGVVDNKDVRINWGEGIVGQGKAWEEYNLAQDRVGEPLPSGAKTFDGFKPATGRATSDKTLDTTAYTYAKNPRKIYSTLANYIDQMANYSRPRQRGDLDPNLIRQKVLELAVPEYTSNSQRDQLQAAVNYGRKRGVLVMITVVADDPRVVAPAKRQPVSGLTVRPAPPVQPAAAIAANELGERRDRRQRQRR